MGWRLDYTGPQMIMCIKVTSLAYSVYDGCVNKANIEKKLADASVPVTGKDSQNDHSGSSNAYKSSDSSEIEAQTNQNGFDTVYPCNQQERNLQVVRFGRHSS